MISALRRDRGETQAVEPPPVPWGGDNADVSRTAKSAEDELDALLATLQHGDLSALELRILLWLADRVGTQRELAEALDVSRGAIGRAAARLSMRGLIRRRFENGNGSRFLLSVTPAGVRAVAPLVESFTVARPARRGLAAGR
jgi:DNA-binding MarR family transcriptional regulator